ncbi:MAG: hypothetical protein WCD18_04760 [Thermosynechococcaceae cyanobacterium]
MVGGNDKSPRSIQSWLLPISTAIIGALVGLTTATVTRINNSETLAKDYVAMAIDILKLSDSKIEPKKDDEAIKMRLELRRWAVEVVNSYSKVKMSPELVSYLASAKGQKLLLQIVDDSKTDTGVLLCPSAKSNITMQELAVKISSALVNSGQFGSSYISEWKDEGPLTSKALKGTISIIKDNGHPEEKMVPAMNTIITAEMDKIGITLPIKTVNNSSSKPSEWYISIVICP